MQYDGLQVLRFLNGEGDLTIPWIVRDLFYFQLIGLQDILPIKVDIECLSVDGISIFLCLA